MRASVLAAAILFAVALLSGCAGREAIPISPLPSGYVGAEFGLGPGIHPLSRGPGDKGSPSWSPDGERIAFIVDGYVVDRPAEVADRSYGPDEERRVWTARDFGASEVAWGSSESVWILGGEEPAATLYRAAPPEEATSVTTSVAEVSPDVLSTRPFGAGEASLTALRSTDSKSTLAITHGDRIQQVYDEPVEGGVTGISLSPTGDEAVLAVRLPGSATSFELRTFDLASGLSRRVALLKDGLSVSGSPQWTERGIYYVAGKETKETGDDEDSGLYELYRLAPNADAPEPAPEVGGDFTASSIQASPEGTRLAIIGRLQPNSPTNLHLLDLESGDFGPLTSSEDMEIKNGPADLAWSPDGEKIAIVARGASSETAVRDVPSEALLGDFYNLYEVPAEPAKESR